MTHESSQIRTCNTKGYPFRKTCHMPLPATGTKTLFQSIFCQMQFDFRKFIDMMQLGIILYLYLPTTGTGCRQPTQHRFIYLINRCKRPKMTLVTRLATSFFPGWLALGWWFFTVFGWG